MTGTKYVIDAGMGIRQGQFFLRPAKQDDDGHYIPDLTQAHVMSDTVGDREIVGIHHEDGPDAVDTFCNEHKDALRKLLAQFL
ncbi:hypothetical protein [Roseibium sp. MMSF_3412]|uniref:hypothetical protein n=1 Tax=Roseibium sp. MMSF_3412 TaxID=3046712 RepID=UPI00273EF261|nr:hypothetical protein [Roseibium sp. MMSF_3412]